MNTEIRSWELVDKVLVAGLLSVIKPHQQKVSFADIWQSHYAPTYHLTTLYLSRLVRSGYLSVYQGAEAVVR